MQKTGILISNLGTPQQPSTQAVRTYLKEFLSDPYVVDKPRWLWLPILYGIILNVRPKASAKKYAEIWQSEGSPLLIYTEKLKKKLQQTLIDTPIALGMRYGTPSLKTAIAELEQSGVKKLILLPLYPQYSLSTTASTWAAVKALLASTQIKPQLIQDYHAYPLYIDALVQSIKAFWAIEGRAQKLILSFHGLPQSFISRGDPYYQQCQKTTALLAAKLNLKPEDYLMTFQSRLGVEKWLQPYTMESMKKLPALGIKNIQVICPGFACDCLETLEEIKMMNQAFFIAAGGEKFSYIPCLNDQETHVNLLKTLILDCDAQSSS